MSDYDVTIVVPGIHDQGDLARIADLEAALEGAEFENRRLLTRLKRAEAALADFTDKSHNWGTMMHESMDAKETAEAALAELATRRCEECVSCDTCAVQNAAWVKLGALEADTGFACNCWAARAEEGSAP